MRIALTGGAGDLGLILAPRIRATGGHPVSLDVHDPNNGTEFINVSTMDRDLLRSALKTCDAVVHIAAWHGIHEFRKERDVYEQCISMTLPPP